MAVDLFKALRTIALRDVLQERSDYHIRHINRWYSMTFHTPLTDVEDLPMEHVLQHYYESKYEDLEAEDREKERAILIETDAQTRKRRMDEEYEAHASQRFEQESMVLRDKLLAERAKKLEQNAASEARSNRPLFAPQRTLPESSLDGLPGMGGALAPNISMTFLSAAEMEAQLNGPSITGGEEDLATGNLTIIPPETK